MSFINEYIINKKAKVVNSRINFQSHSLVSFFRFKRTLALKVSDSTLGTSLVLVSINRESVS